MRAKLFALAGAAALSFAATGAYAQCVSSGGAVGGATAGAATGAVIGGPVGAAAGAVIGGSVGAQALSPTACSYVVQTHVPVVAVEGDVVVGQPLPETVVLHPIPETDAFVFAYVNNKRVIVDPKTRVVTQIVVQ